MLITDKPTGMFVYTPDGREGFIRSGSSRRAAPSGVNPGYANAVKETWSPEFENKMAVEMIPHGAVQQHQVGPIEYHTLSSLRIREDAAGDLDDNYGNNFQYD